MFKGKPPGRVSWDYSSGVARFTKEILQGNIPENMPFRHINIYLQIPSKPNIKRIITVMGKAIK